MNRSAPGRRRLCTLWGSIAAALLALPSGLACEAHARPGTDEGISRSPDGGAVLHRRLPPSGEGPVGPGEAPVFVYDPHAEAALPREIHRDGQALPRPEAEAGPEEAVYTPGGVRASRPAGELASLPQPMDDGAPPGGLGVGDAAPGEVDIGDSAPVEAAWTDGGQPLSPPAGEPTPRPLDDPRGALGDTAHPDRHTERESTLEYRTVFDPSVVPFKRNRALDTIAADYSLRVSEGPHERLEPVGNVLARSSEVFWGSVSIEAAAGERVPLPSVSPESRVLSYEASPDVPLVFERDRAGNFYVTPAVGGRTRLVFVMDAPAAYFGREVPRGLTARDVPAHLRPEVPRAIVREAMQVARAVGVGPETPYDALLDRLVGYFRGFEPGEPLPAVASPYLDLALGRRGICRHRGYAFVVTAQALGVPARYVFNEAHVFVEVFIPGPEAGWLRVDLGGGADRLVVHGGEERSLHQPDRADPFHQPEGYARALADGHAAGATQVEGLPGSRWPEAAPSGADGVEGDALPEAVRDMLNRAIPRPAPAPDKIPTRTTMEVAEAWVFRGEGLRVSGRVTERQGRPVRHGSVQLLLLFGEERRAVALLGTALVDSDGLFTANVGVPEDQPPGDYSVVAEFLGTARHAPSSSR